MANIGALSVTIGADTRGLEQGVGRAENRLARFGRSARNAVNQFARIGAAAAAAGTAIAFEFTRRGMRAVDELAKLSRQLDGSIDGLRGLRIAAQDAGIATGVMDSAMERFNARLGEAQRGTGTAREALDRLGLSARELASLDVDQRMATIADRVRELGLSGAQTSDVLRQFGIRNTEIANLMREGGDAIRGARGEVDALGLSLSAVDAAQVEAANDAMSRFGMVLEGIQQRMAVALAPLIEEISLRFQDAAIDAEGWGDQTIKAIESVARAAAFLVDAVEGLRRVLMLVGLAAAAAGAQLTSMAVNVQNAILRGPTWAVQQLIGLLNRLPGVSIPDVAGQARENIQGFADEAQAQFEGFRERIDGLLHEPLPGEAVRQFFDDVEERSRSAAEQIAEDRERIGSVLDMPGLAGPGESEGGASEEDEARRDQLERRLEMLREYMMDEAELEEHRHAERMEELHEFFEEELIAEEEFRHRKEEIEEDHMAKMQDIKERGMSDIERFLAASMSRQTAIIAGGAADMTSALARESKTAFEINKTASMVQASMKGWEAAQSAWAAGMATGGPAAPAVAAAYTAASLAKTGAQLSALRRQSFSRGGSSASAGAAGGGQPVTPTNGGGGGGGGQEVRRSITIRGEGVSQEWIRDSLVPALNEAAGDGASFQG